MYQYRETFNAVYDECGPDECKRFEGKPFTVVEVIETPNEGYDPEVLPMFQIECDGVTFAAWPEEVLSE